MGGSSTKLHEKPLVTPDEAKEIEEKLCRTKIDPAAAKSYFESLETFDELRDFMVCVVLAKMPNPMYRFESVDEENTDNVWWGSDAWKMMVVMNVRGLVTFESEENSPPESEDEAAWSREHKVASRASVSGVMLNDQRTRDLLRKVNLEGMVAYSHPFSENNVYFSGEMDEFGNPMQMDWTMNCKIDCTYVDDKHHASLPTSLPLSELALTGSPLEDVLRRCVVVNFIDPNFDIPASDSLFPTILRYL